MSKLKEKIYIKQWLDLKPYNSQVPADSYYLKLCNDVKKSFITSDQSFVFKGYLQEDEIDALACFLTSYFEDIISGTNIWNSFIRVYKRLYGRYLPFYETGEYYEQEINLADISFLIWYFMNTIQLERFIAPFNDFIIEASVKIMDVFENAWEYAPENEFLKTFYSIDEKETDFYKARILIDNLLFKSYLFYPDSLMDLRSSEIEVMEENKNDEHLINLLNENRNNKLHTTYTRLLALKGQQWMAEILGDNHSLSKQYSIISRKISGYFFYKGQDKENVFLEHIASGKKFNLTKKSFDHYDSLTDIDTILFMGIVQWRNEWWFSGVYFQAEFNPDLVLDEKNSISSRSAVSFLDHQNKDIEDMLDKQFKAFKKFNNNQQIAFMNSHKIEKFIEDYIEFFNNSLKLSRKEKDAAKKRAREDGFFGNEKDAVDFSGEPVDGLVFFNPQKGVEVAFEINSAFPMKDNSFFTSEESRNHIMHLFCNEEFSTELVLFCIDNFKDDLKFFKTAEGKMLLDNIDFLLRFWKRGNYFT